MKMKKTNYVFSLILLVNCVFGTLAAAAKGKCPFDMPDVKRRSEERRVG